MDQLKKGSKIFLGVLFGITVVAVTGLTVAKSVIKQPSTEALQALEDASVVGESYAFSGDPDKPMLIFYPGAGVEAGSYSIWAKKVAEAGYPVFLVNMPLQLAFLAADRANEILDMYPNRDYVMAGHSLGGAISSRFAAEHVKNDQHLKGIVYMSSFSSKSQQLKESDLPALVLTATEDKDILEKDVLSRQGDYPRKSRFASIKGGNHLGFGSVQDAQPGSISNEFQQEEVASMLLAWLDHDL